MKSRALNRIGFFILFLLAVVLLLFLLLQLPAVQNYAQKKILESISERLDVEWQIDRIKVDFFDEVTLSGVKLLDQQNDTLVVADELWVDIGVFNLLRKVVKLDAIQLSGARVKLYEQDSGVMNFSFLLSDSTEVASTGEVLTSAEKDQASGWQFSLGEIQLRDNIISYETSEQNVHIKEDLITIGIQQLDLEQKRIDIEDITLLGLDASIELAPSSEPAEGFSLPALGWNMGIDKISISESKARYASGSDKVTIKDINTELRKVNYTDTALLATVQDMSADINNKVQLKKLETAIQLKGSLLEIPKLNVVTNRDRLQLSALSFNIDRKKLATENINAQISALSLQELQPYIPSTIKLKPNTDFQIQGTEISYNPKYVTGKGIVLEYGGTLNLKGNVQLSLADKISADQYINASLEEMAVNLNEFEQLFPTFEIPDSLRRFTSLNLKGDMAGTMSDLAINRLDVKIDDFFKGILSGTIRNIRKPELLSYELMIEELSAVVKDLPISRTEQLALDSLGTIGYNGKIKGTMKNVDLDGSLVSDLGTAIFNVQLNLTDSIQNLNYDGELSLNDFNLGVLLKNEAYDKITIATKITGKGIDLAHLDSKLQGSISNFSYSGYKYETLSLNAFVKDSSINGQIVIADPNLSLRYDGRIDVSKRSSIYDFTASIDTVNVKALGFINNNISFSGIVDSKINLPLLPGTPGRIDVRDFRMSNLSETFYADTISLQAEKSMDSTSVALRSDFMSLDLDGVYNLKDLPTALKRLVDYHLVFIDYGELPETESQNLTVKGSVKTLEPINIWLEKNLIQSKILDVDTYFDFASQEVNGRIAADSLFYEDNLIEKLNIALTTENKLLQADVLGTNADIQGNLIPTLAFKNVLSPEIIKSSFLAADKDALPSIKFGFETTLPDTDLLIRFQDSLILNRKEWSINRENRIVLSDEKVLISDFEMTDGTESLTVESRGEQDEVIAVNFDNFGTDQLTPFLGPSASSISGNIFGDIEVRDLYSSSYYVANLLVENLVYDSTEVGVLKVSAADDPQTNLLTTKVTLRGPSNDLIGAGTYNTTSKAIDLDFDVYSLELMLLDPFFSEVFYDSKGKISGNIQLDGQLDKPSISGQVKLKDIATTIAVNQVRYSVTDHQINFDNSTFRLDDLIIRDKVGNTSTVNGTISHDAFSSFNADMQVVTNNFLLLNTTAIDNPVFYGKLKMDAIVQMQGPFDLMDISIAATTLTDTDVTLSPLASEQFKVEEDYIIYGKPDDFADISSEYLLKVARQFPFRVDLSLDVTKAADFSFVVDPLTGDRIDVAGSGDLRIVLNPDGQQEIYGRYRIDNGSYNFSYGDFISKQFSLKPGGSISFNGDPLKAKLDIEAIYKVYTSTYGLIKNEVAAESASSSAALERTNVEVHLSLEGTLDEPIINLDIQVPDQQSNSFVSSIDRKLNELRKDPNAMNTQVFNLLLFDNFLVADNNVSTFGDIGSGIALSSISNLISNELNRLAGNVIKGVDVSINVDSYNSQYANNGSGGTVTEVGLNLSKRLFNDRLSLSAGGNIDFANTNGSAQTYAALVGDFVLEYKLVESGRLNLRVFSKSDYDRLLNENRNKNGISLFFNRSFDSKLAK